MFVVRFVVKFFSTSLWNFNKRYHEKIVD
jgi:hypothetical protein